MARAKLKKHGGTGGPRNFRGSQGASMGNNMYFSPYEQGLINEGQLMSVHDCVKCGNALGQTGQGGNVHNCVKCVDHMSTLGGSGGTGNMHFSPYELGLINEGQLMSVHDCVKCGNALGQTGQGGNVTNCVRCVDHMSAL